jgi:purine nucleosidase
MKSYSIVLTIICIVSLFSCERRNNDSQSPDRMRIIFDTDANNELDDQHALAYLLFNKATFDVAGVTVNATRSGGNIDQQYEEAKRVMQLTGDFGKIPLLKGADDSFQEIQTQLAFPEFQGHDAVTFIIDEALKASEDKKLILLAVGKLTNVALALEKEPSIAGKIRLVWLGSNYPEPGEYNQDNDTVAMNYLLNRDVPFEMVTVRYGRPDGTAAVTATQKEIEQKMPGLGPEVESPVEGRHGGKFSTFGDYSVDLFRHIDYYDEQKSRALFDMVAVAILKNPSWGEKREIPAPILINNQWAERPDNNRMILVWENFDKQGIMEDFYAIMNKPSTELDRNP